MVFESFADEDTHSDLIPEALKHAVERQEETIKNGSQILPEPLEPQPKGRGE